MALLVWLVLCYYFQPWMIPAACLLVFFKLYIVRVLTGPSSVPWDEVVESDIDEEEDDDKEKVKYVLRYQYACILSDFIRAYIIGTRIWLLVN